MKRRYKIAAVLTIAAVAVLIIGIVRSQRFARNVRRIQVGDSKETVLGLLGEPTCEFTPYTPEPGFLYLGVYDETWAYGKTVECNFAPEFPYFWPFKLRLFGPDADDVAIEFDDQGHVSQVSVPVHYFE